MKLNTKVARTTALTHEGGPAQQGSPERQLRRAVMSCLLWEKQFYESGADIAARIADLVPKVTASKVREIAVEARTEMKLRHVPLLLAREMLRYPEHKREVANTLRQIIQRPDELTEFLALYWKDGRVPLAAQVKKGLSDAFTKFTEYQLAKYDRDGAVRLRDVMFLVHPKPRNMEQAEVWERLVKRELKTPDTWEVAISAATDKRAEWTRLLTENKLGALALLRNLRNMQQAGVDVKWIRKALASMETERVLPFRFMAAAQHAPQLEPELENAMLKSLEGSPKLPGKTVIVVDVSGSMSSPLSSKSEMTRLDAAASIAVLLREVCEDPIVYATGGSDWAGKHATKAVPLRSGFALADAIKSDRLGGGGIFLAQCMDHIAETVPKADRVIVIMDEQDCDKLRSAASARIIGKTNYVINVASYKNGIEYSAWTKLDGWSESVVQYIQQSEVSGQ